MKQKLTELKREIDIFVIAGDFNNVLSIINRAMRQNQ